MSIQRVTCPACSASANIPAGMSNVKCQSCGAIWNVANPSAASSGGASRSASPQSGSGSKDDSSISGMVIGLIGGGSVLGLGLLGAVFVLNRNPLQPNPTNSVGSPSAQHTAAAIAANAPEPTIKPAVPEPYREIGVPEEERRRIYNEYRQMAVTTVEKPLLVPQGSAMRQSPGGNVR